MALAAGLAACQGNDGRDSGSSVDGRGGEPGAVAGEDISAAMGQPGTGRDDDVLKGFGELPGQAAANAIRASVHEYFAAVVAGDVQRACAATSRALRRHLATFEQAGGRAQCSELVLNVFGNFSGASLRLLSRAEVTKIRIQADHALVAYSVPGPRWSTLPMDREGGAWKVGRYDDWSGDAER
jgi:hypothetical protein